MTLKELLTGKTPVQQVDVLNAEIARLTSELEGQSNLVTKWSKDFQTEKTRADGLAAENTKLSEKITAIEGEKTKATADLTAALAKLEDPKNFKGFDAAVAQAAGEEVANSGHKPLKLEKENEVTGDKKTLIEQYNALPPADRTAFYRKHEAAFRSASRPAALKGN